VPEPEAGTLLVVSAAAFQDGTSWRGGAFSGVLAGLTVELGCREMRGRDAGECGEMRGDAGGLGVGVSRGTAQRASPRGEGPPVWERVSRVWF
jgi:hypothetical protein